jgi:hypothetical protein
MKKNTDALLKKIPPIKAQKLAEVIEEPMDNFTINEYLPNCPVIRYSDLSNLRDIKELLKKDGSYCIILYQQSENSGHYVALYRQNGVINYFCSYGSYPDSQLKWVSPQVNKQLGINPYITELFKQSDLPILYNSHPLQDKKDTRIATCGRWCICMIKCLKKGSTMKEFIRQYKNSKLPPDLLVAEKIDKLNSE